MRQVVNEDRDDWWMRRELWPLFTLILVRSVFTGKLTKCRPDM